MADAYLNSATPYIDTMATLNKKFDQPHQLALNRIAAVMNAPDICRGDFEAFERFALQVRALVGMLKTFGTARVAELRCGSHVSRLLCKLPPELRASYCRQMFHRPCTVYTPTDFADWLQYESWCQDEEGGRNTSSRDCKITVRSTTILHGSGEPPSVSAKNPTAQP